MLVWIRWSLTGTRVLFVYSNSPVWQSYIENNIVPRLPPKSVVLNWSEELKGVVQKEKNDNGGI